MANEKQAAQDSQIERRAFDLFTARRAAFGVQQNAADVAKQCFRDARAFIDVSQKIADGEMSIELPKGPQLADCCAPNLKPTHPVNMVSQRFGNLQRVKEINARLEANEKLETLEEYDWGIPEVNSARNLFPKFCSAN